MALCLPWQCLAAHPVTGEPILIERGVSGYTPAPCFGDLRLQNEAAGISPEQAQAMLAGANFCWESDLTNPDLYVGQAVDPYGKGLLSGEAS